jgi:3-deoxy-D-manno-octulosonic-acid transferase
MWFYLYNFILHLTAVLLSPVLFLLVLLNAYGLRERLGFWTFPGSAGTDRLIWFHAASVGEVTALATVVDVLMKSDPQARIVVSTTSASGRTRAAELIPGAAHVFLAPLDAPWPIRRVLRRLQPSAFIVTETELWPNTIRLAGGYGCRIGMINGRLSEKSVKRYRRIRGSISRLLQQFDVLCVQTELDRDRFLALGAGPDRIAVLGNIKLDLHRSILAAGKAPVSRKALGIAEEARVIVAGSTRPGEEEMLISAYPRIREAEPKTVLIIAPRHLDRLPEVEQLLQERGLGFARRTAMDGSQNLEAGLLLLDTMGELSSLYSLADIAFVGGSLVPLGGHNPLEPAMWGIPVLFGPYRDNVRQLTDWLLESQGGVEIRDSASLAESAVRLLGDPEERQRRGRAALKVVESKTGASTRTVRFLKSRGVL